MVGKIENKKERIERKRKELERVKEKIKRESWIGGEL